MSLQEIKHTFVLHVSLYLVFSLYHAALFYLREKHSPPVTAMLLCLREICTECFERLVTRTQHFKGCKMLHFESFIQIYFLKPLMGGGGGGGEGF